MNYCQTLTEFSAIFSLPAHYPAGLRPGCEVGLEVYRNNVCANRSHALASAFPTVEALLGPAFFAELARSYMTAKLSYSGDLHEDGLYFSDHIAQESLVADLPYLADVARLDWALHRAHQAIDLAPLTYDQLAALDENTFCAMHWQLHPAMTLVRSDFWPIGAILEFHHDMQLAPDLTSGGQAVWVWRDHWEIVSAADAVCLSSLLHAGPAHQAFEQAQDCDSTFNPTDLVTRILQRGLLVGLHGALT
jgi:hypothetical protein